MPYFAINNLVATEFPDNTSVEVLKGSYEYVLKRTFPIQDSGSKYHYDFNLIHGSQINRSGWIISGMYTFSSLEPREILFGITDPCGMSDNDIEIYMTVNGLNCITFPGLGLQTLN